MSIIDDAKAEAERLAAETGEVYAVIPTGKAERIIHQFKVVPEKEVEFKPFIFYSTRDKKWVGSCILPKRRYRS